MSFELFNKIIHIVYKILMCVYFAIIQQHYTVSLFSALYHDRIIADLMSHNMICVYI